MEKEKKKKRRIRWWGWLIIAAVAFQVLLVIIAYAMPNSGNEGTANSLLPAVPSTTESETTTNVGGYTLPHGEVLDVVINERDEYNDKYQLVIKARVEMLPDSRETIEQNYMNVVDLIQNQGCEKYDEIQYWAVAKPNGGTEQKIIQFTLSKDIIDGIAKGDISAYSLGQYIEVTRDYWVYPSLANNIATTEAIVAESGGLHVEYGEMLDASVDEGKNILSVKVKITDLYGDKLNALSTNRNYYNVWDLIENQGCDKYDAIHYYAVAELGDGTQVDAMRFTLDKDGISSLKNGEFAIIDLGDYLSANSDDFWISPDLQ